MVGDAEFIRRDEANLHFSSGSLHDPVRTGLADGLAKRRRPLRQVGGIGNELIDRFRLAGDGHGQGAGFKGCGHAIFKTSSDGIRVPPVILAELNSLQRSFQMLRWIIGRQISAAIRKQCFPSQRKKFLNADHTD